ncbi:MAG: hypothetical protein NZ741_02325 [Armatimonadetes bacterium]|nr:hypothetical protein [Armatimonadota bacterium]
MTRTMITSAYRFAVIALVLAVVGLVTLAVGARASGLEMLAFSGLLLLLAAVVLGMVALVWAVVNRAYGVAIVLAAIALLMPGIALTWLFLPAIRSARTVSQQRRCMQNLKALGMAVLLYTEDWDERYPPAHVWCDSIRPYARSPEDFRCPAARHLQSGYAMNDQLDSLKVEDLVTPSETVMLFDSTGGWNQAGGKEQVARRHGETANFAFADGHVAYRYRMDELTWGGAETPPAQ